VTIVRHFRNGQSETWWALEVDVGPYGPEKPIRAVVATTDPATLPEHGTWYLTANLPAPIVIVVSPAPFYSPSSPFNKLPLEQ